MPLLLQGIFLILFLSVRSPITPKSCVCDIISSKWRYGWGEAETREPGGLERTLWKSFDPTQHLLIFTSQKADIWDWAFMLECLWHTDEGRGDNGKETRGWGLSFDSAGDQRDSGHACCCDEHIGTVSVCSHGSRPVENEEQCRQEDRAL